MPPTVTSRKSVTLVSKTRLCACMLLVVHPPLPLSPPVSRLLPCPPTLPCNRNRVPYARSCTESDLSYYSGIFLTTDAKQGTIGSKYRKAVYRCASPQHAHC